MFCYSPGLMLKLALGDCVVVHDCASRDMFWPEVRPLATTLESNDSSGSIKTSDQETSRSTAALLDSDSITSISSSTSSISSLDDEEEELGSTSMAFPRAIWWGLEWVRFALKRAWQLDATTSSSSSSSSGSNANDSDNSTKFSGEGQKKQSKGKSTGARSQWTLRGYPVDDLFEQKYRALPKSLQKKLKYYRPYVAAAATEV